MPNPLMNKKVILMSHRLTKGDHLKVRGGNSFNFHAREVQISRQCGRWMINMDLLNSIGSCIECFCREDVGHGIYALYRSHGPHM